MGVFGVSCAFAKVLQLNIVREVSVLETQRVGSEFQFRRFGAELATNILQVVERFATQGIPRLAGASNLKRWEVRLTRG